MMQVYHNTLGLETEVFCGERCLLGTCLLIGRLQASRTFLKINSCYMQEIKNTLLTHKHI